MLICPKCKKCKTKVIDSRPAENGQYIRRRRECPECKFRYSTKEFQIESNEEVVALKKELNEVRNELSVATKNFATVVANLERIARENEELTK